VEPDLGAGEDVEAPWAHRHILSGQALTDPQAKLSIWAAQDARWMYLREWVMDPDSGDWSAAQDSGWIGYGPYLDWTLSRGAGVKYIGIWVADHQGNISHLDEHSIDYTNYLDPNSSLNSGQRHQYRFNFRPGELVIYNLLANSGDPDLYVWNPRHALLPNHVAESVQLVDALGFYTGREGVYLLEVIARGDSSYQLLPLGDFEAESLDVLEKRPPPKERPEHPLTVTDPISAGIASAPEITDLILFFLPLIFK